MSDRVRIILAIALSGIILISFQFYYAYNQRQEGSGVIEEAIRQEGAEDTASSFSPTEPVVEGSSDFRMERSDVLVSGEDIVVETDLMIVTLNTRGGSLKSLELKRDTRDRQALIRLIPEMEPDSHYPLETFSDGVGSSILFQTDWSDLYLTPEEPSGSIVLSHTNADGGTINKIFTFSNDSYEIDVEVEVRGDGLSRVGDGDSMTFAWSLWQGGESDLINKRFPEVVFRFFQFFYRPLTNEGASSRDINFIQLVSYIRKANNPELGPDKGRFPVTKMEKPVSFREEVEWISLNDRDFVVALLPKKGESQRDLTSDVFFERVGEDKIRASIGVRPYTDTFTAGVQGANYGLKIYAGPKAYSILREMGVGLQKTIDFGFLRPISEVLLQAMIFVNDWTNNYGVAIILLTIVIKIILYPLTYSSMTSMKKMQTLQPEIAALKEKYKDDSAKMNKEMMGLYRKRGLNPLGGCLPLVLQMPIFFAFYTTLRSAVELRGAEFLWMADLSEKDPLFVLPILMGVSMFAQQRMTPAQDPRMKMLTYMMPLIFTVMFFNFPSGLVLYWLVSNVLQIGQQYYINKRTTAKTDQEESKNGKNVKVQKVEKKQVAAVDKSNQVNTIPARRKRRKR